MYDFDVLNELEPHYYENIVCHVWIYDYLYWDSAKKNLKFRTDIDWDGANLTQKDLKRVFIPQNEFKDAGATDVELLGLWIYDEEQQLFMRQFVGESIMWKVFRCHDEYETHFIFTCPYDVIVGQDEILFCEHFSSRWDAYDRIEAPLDNILHAIKATERLRSTMQKETDFWKTRFEALREAVENLSLLPGMKGFDETLKHFNELNLTTK